MGQFSKYLIPGSVRIVSSCNGFLFCTAFLRPDGMYFIFHNSFVYLYFGVEMIAVVVLNVYDFPITFKLQHEGSKAANITIPSHAIATYIYQNS